MSPQDNPPRSRRSVRAKWINYATPGLYFVTICVQDRALVLGKVVGREVVLSPMGAVARGTLLDIRSPGLVVEEEVVMPNHLHVLFRVVQMQPRPIGRVVGWFKHESIRRMREMLGIEPGRLWQRNYYERKLRVGEYESTVGYMRDNPARWHGDPINPACGPADADPEPWDLDVPEPPAAGGTAGS